MYIEGQFLAFLTKSIGFQGAAKPVRRAIGICSRCGLAMILILCVSSLAVADTFVKKPERIDPVTIGLTHLLDVVEKETPTKFDPRLVGPVLDFVASDKKPPVTLDLDATNKATGAYGEFSVQKSLRQILKLIYHPRIPSYLFCPTSTRISYWKEIKGRSGTLPAIWKMKASANKPVIISGVERETTAPDLNSGAYYQYDLDRTLIFYKHKGSNVFISLTKQDGVSEVGHKGIVLGDDEDWNYFYSGKKGLTKMPVLGNGVDVPGLSKIESYMYDSYSILVYYEIDSKQPLVKCGVFKWVNAGWKNINMVKKKHVKKGILRYAKSFKSIIESPYLPSSREISNVLISIEQMNIKRLRKIAKTYLHRLEQKCQSEGLKPNEMFINLVQSETYIKQITKKEIQSILALEYMKGALQKEQILSVNKKGKPGEI